MKNSLYLLLSLLMLLGFVIGCSSGGGDDDDNGSDDDVADDDSFLDDDSASDDDAADDDAADDDSADDDDTPGGPHAPVITSFHLFVASTDPQFELWGEKRSPWVVGLNEAAIAAPIYSDPECDLDGGEMYYILDGGEATKYMNIPPNIPCQYSASGTIYGYDLQDIPGALDPSSKGHLMEIWWIDKKGHESIHKNFNYTVEDSPYAHGGTAEDFTLTDKDGNEVSLSDYDGEIVVIEGYTGWCTYCAQEAGELATLQTEWNTDGDPVQVLGLMSETAGSSMDVQQSDLQIYSSSHGWDDLIPALDDGGAAVQYDYWLGGGYPFNMILDADHVVMVKWHGFATGWIENYVNMLLAK